jgi:hypothetical protein
LVQHVRSDTRYAHHFEMMFQVDDALCSSVYGSVSRLKRFGVLLASIVRVLLFAKSRGEQGSRFAPGDSDSVYMNYDSKRRTYFMKCLCFELFNFAVTGDIRLSVGEAIRPLRSTKSKIVSASKGICKSSTVSSTSLLVLSTVLSLLTLFPYQPELLPFPEDPSCRGK